MSTEVTILHKYSRGKHREQVNVVIPKQYCIIQLIALRQATVYFQITKKEFQ